MPNGIDITPMNLQRQYLTAIGLMLL